MKLTSEERQYISDGLRQVCDKLAHSASDSDYMAKYLEIYFVSLIENRDSIFPRVPLRLVSSR